jgi:hypothetical protein
MGMGTSQSQHAGSMQAAGPAMPASWHSHRLYSCTYYYSAVPW